MLLEAEGVSGTAIGLLSSTVGIGMLVGGVVMPAVLSRVPLATLLVAAAFGSAVLLLLMKLLPGYWSWLALRLAASLCGTALFYGSELWIVVAAPEARRGTWIGIYGVFLALGFFAGPALLALVGTEGWPPFLWGAGLMLAAALPAVLARRRAPRDLGGPPRPLLETLGFFRSDPSLVAGVLLFACFEFGMLGLLPVWGIRSGMEEAAAILLVSAVAFAGVVLDVPIGWATDRMDRRLLLVLAGAALLVMGLAMPPLAGAGPVLLVVLFLCGGLAVALYVVPLAEFAARYRGPDLARANGAVIVAYGLGALLSPAALGAAMDAVPPHGLAHGLAALALAFLALVLARGLLRRRAAPRS